MKKYLWIVAVLVVAALVVLGIIYREPLVLRVTGMRPFVEERFGGWVEAGADEQELDAALRRVHDPLGSGPGSWVYELSQPAAEHEAAAREAEAANDTATAAQEYQKAAVFYFVARFPFVSTPAKAEAYRKHIECYLEAAKYFDPPLEQVRIPFEGKTIIGYLRVPDVGEPPVVIVTGGVDTWKSDVERQCQAMLAEGMAVFAFDMPGTGESQWALDPTSDRVYGAVVEYLKARGDLDGENIGVYLQSFAGLFAVKLALVDPDVKAAVNIGGPIHLAFTPEHIKKVPDVMVKTIANAMREDLDASFEETVSRAKPMSLGEQGLLKKPERQAALLSINGDQDPLVPIEDLYIISKSGIQQDEWVYAGDGHCAPDNLKEHAPKAASWLKAHLAKPEKAPSAVELESGEAQEAQ
ncbi:MAG: alpha/beta hydrolase [Candidatus Abyssobacteria bacterium SURF_17]|uniref:Alpha/beta hydrolase n=1 Tax=Candidatus Abyssobacteria bacterium SURF_17 TaxID=2093361 RepID=A0A419EW32_9BACT|nr:MAG: alpha/beta hydrolase [Candidatus Abyssubacteria bacterium SURF_17]